MQQYIICTDVQGDTMFFFQREDDPIFCVTELMGPPGMGFGIFPGNGLDPDTDEDLQPLKTYTAEEYGTLANAERVAVQQCYQMCMKQLGINLG